MHEEDAAAAADKAKVFLPALPTRCKQDENVDEGLRNWKVHSKSKYEITSIIKLTFVFAKCQQIIENQIA